MKNIVAELLLDRMPDEVGGWLRDANDGEHLLGDAVVEPAKNTLVHNAPIGIATLSGGRRRGEMIAEAEFSDEGVEERSPLGIVGLSEFKHHWNVGLDINCLEDGGGRSLDDSAGEGVAVDRGRRGGVGVSIGQIRVEEWVAIHGWERSWVWLLCAGRKQWGIGKSPPARRTAFLGGRTQGRDLSS
jgi:hypothetical protein